MMSALTASEAFSRVRTWAIDMGPVRAAFFGSLLLSLIAISTHGTLNRDGMLYVDVARIVLQDGFSAARAVFNWPFLPVLIAGTSRLTGLGLENSGHLLNASLWAGACALMVATVRHEFPAVGWAVCFAVLSMPAFNQYRNEILREPGCWFFTLLAFWFALRWSDKPRWGGAIAVQVALLVAALFRSEALAFFPALIFWQLFSAPKGERLHRASLLGGLPLIGLLILVLLFSTGQLSSGNRLAGDLSHFVLARFDEKVLAIAATFREEVRPHVPAILFFGSLGIIPLKFFKMMSVFIIPFSYPFFSESGRALLQNFRIFAWAFVAHLLVLAVYVMDQQFLIGRHTSALHLLSVPVVAAGGMLMAERYPRFRALVMMMALLIMIGNVATLSPKKLHYADAGAWLADNFSRNSRIYVEDERVGYYAGWGFIETRSKRKDRTALGHALAENKYDAIVLDVAGKDSGIEEWMSANGIRPVRRFLSGAGDAVIIAVPVSSHASPEITARSRPNTASTE